MNVALALGAIAIIGLGVWQFMNNQPEDVAAGMQEIDLNEQAAAAAAAQAAAPVTLENGLVIQDAKIGTGEEAKAGMRLSMHYTGTLDDGTVFDSSVARNDPFEFTLGTGEVIPGWDIGIQGMRVGGERKLTIPPALGYGAQGVGPIPPNSTLHFEVVLLGIEQ